MKRDISNLRMWKDLLWILVGCYGLFCIWLLFDSYSQTLASNTEMLNSLYFPHYLAASSCNYDLCYFPHIK